MSHRSGGGDDDVRWFSETLDRCALLSSAKRSGHAKVVERALEHLRLSIVKMPPRLLKGLEHCRRAVALDRAALEAGIELKRDILAAQCGAKVAHLVKASKLLDRLMPTHAALLNLAFCASQVIDGPTERIVELAQELLEQWTAALKAQHRPDTMSRAASAAALAAAAKQADCDIDEKRLAQIAGVSVRDMRKIDALHAALPSVQPASRPRITSRAVNAARTALRAASLKPKRTAIHPEHDHEPSPRVEAPVAPPLSPFDDWAREQLIAHFDKSDLPQLTKAAHISAAFTFALKGLPERAHREETTPAAAVQPPLKRIRTSS